MVALYLTEYAIHDVMNEPGAVADCLQHLETSVTSLAAVFGMEISQVKRLSGIRSPVPFFRFRKGMRRVIFTPASPQGEVGLVVWRIGLRDRVYEELERLLRFFDFAVDWPVTELFMNPEGFEAGIEDATPTTVPAVLPLPSWDRYYRPPLTPDWLAYVSSEAYHYRPCLTQQQQTWVQGCLNGDSTIFAVQGAAGTGKTTMALALTAAASETYQPVVVVPNAKSVAYAQRWLAAQPLPEAGQAPMVTTADQVLGARLNRREANQRLQQQLKFEQAADWYGMLRGYVTEGTYPEAEREPLSADLVAIAMRLQTLWTADKEHTILEGLDAWGQTPTPQTFGSPVLLIIDEVQDLFWYQIRAIIQTYRPQRLILMGDRNQRVVKSGFSWRALAQAMARELDLTLPLRYQPERNFRNTRSITRVANFLLLEAFNTPEAAQRYSLPDPESCVEVGEKPRLLAVEAAWLETVLVQLQMSLTHLDPHIAFVFLVPDDPELTGRIQALDSERLLTYPITEAKGQEFNGAVLLYPFEQLGQPVTTEDLYQLYTAITRVRRYLSIVIRPETLQNLKKLISQERLEKLFDLRALHPAAFVNELQQEARSFLSSEQRAGKYLSDLAQTAWAWLKGESRYPRWDLRFDLSWPQVATVLPSITSEWSATLTHLPEDLERLNPLQHWAIYCGFAGLVTDAALLSQWDEHVVGQLTSLTPAVLATLEAPTPLLQSLLLQAQGESWQAAAALDQDGVLPRDRDRRITAIAQALVAKGLPFEALRLRIRHGLASPDPNLPFAAVLNQSGDLVTLVCERYCQTLEGIKNE